MGPNVNVLIGPTTQILIGQTVGSLAHMGAEVFRHSGPEAFRHVWAAGLVPLIAESTSPKNTKLSSVLSLKHTQTKNVTPIRSC